MDHQTETSSGSSSMAVSPDTESVEKASSPAVSNKEDGQTGEAVHTTGKEEVVEGSITTTSGPWKKDHTFFFSFVTFRVEDQLFRVPRDPFENQSEHFRKLFANVWTGATGTPNGDIDVPIFLDGIEKDAFRNLLRLMYPPSATSAFTGPILLIRDQWIKLLDLAQTGGFSGIRSLSINRLKLAQFDEVEKLELAIKYEIEQWYADAYLALAKRQEPLTVEEGQRLGIELSLKMARVRERRMVRIMKNMGNSSGIAAFGEPQSTGQRSERAPSPDTSAGSSDMVKQASFSRLQESGKTTSESRQSNSQTPSGSSRSDIATGSSSTSGRSSPPPPPDTLFSFSMRSPLHQKSSTSGDTPPAYSGPDVDGPCSERRKSVAMSIRYHDDVLLSQDIKETFGL